LGLAANSKLQTVNCNPKTLKLKPLKPPKPPKPPNQDPRALRTRLLVWPREHGAWGILGIPLVTGAAAGLRHGGEWLPLLLFALAAFALFCLRTPVESLLGASPMRAQTPEERRTVCMAAAALGIVSFLTLAGLFWQGRNRGLLLLGALTGVLFLLQMLVRKLGRRGRTPAQLIGALGLTGTAAGAYYAVTQRLDLVALALWLANWAFAANQIHFVQTRIWGAKLTTWRQKLTHGRMFLAGEIVTLILLLAGWACGLLPTLTLLAFLPVLIRGTAWFFQGAQPLDVHRLGLSELAHALGFGVLLVVAFLV
jgi:hypothetical protein